MIRLAVLVPQEHADIVLAELLELAPAGVEEKRVAPRMVEFAIYGAPGELPALPDLNAAVGDALVGVSTSEVADDWHERWKRFHRAVLVEPPESVDARHAPPPAIRIRPPWEPAAPDGGRLVQEIVIDPGQAFGTGSHPTTRLCLQLLLELAAHETAEGPLLDVGTGSGVLAIAAARLGFSPVTALDHDPDSVRAARANAAANAAHVDVRRLDLRSEPLPSPAVPGQAVHGTVLVANLLRPLLLELAQAIGDTARHLIAGGMLPAEVDEVANAFADATSLRERRRLTAGDWAALWLHSG